MELQFRESAVDDLNSFSAGYQEAFYDLFLDSGLWNESSIIDGYKQNAKHIRNDILANIRTKLSLRKILGRKVGMRNRYELLFHVARRLVIVFYSEDKETDTRWVESISIDRKPIIF